MFHKQESDSWQRKCAIRMQNSSQKIRASNDMLSNTFNDGQILQPLHTLLTADANKPNLDCAIKRGHRLPYYNREGYLQKLERTGSAKVVCHPSFKQKQFCFIIKCQNFDAHFLFRLLVDEVEKIGWKGWSSFKNILMKHVVTENSDEKKKRNRRKKRNYK